MRKLNTDDKLDVEQVLRFKEVHVLLPNLDSVSLFETKVRRDIKTDIVELMQLCLNQKGYIFLAPD